MATPSGEVAQMLAFSWAALLRARTGPQCPEGNLRELRWHSNPNCGIARERQKKKKKKKKKKTKKRERESKRELSLEKP